MKHIKLILLLLFFFSFVSIYNCTAKPKLVFGTRSHPDNQGGCEGTRGICIIIGLRHVADNFDVKDLGDDMGLAEVEIVDGQLKWNILYQADNQSSKNFTVIRNIELDPNICIALGYRRIEIEAGEYGIDYSRFQFGSILLNVNLR